jgi:hypothetical protein
MSGTFARVLLLLLPLPVCVRFCLLLQGYL